MSADLINKLVEQFEERVGKRSKKTTQTFIDDCKLVLTEHFSNTSKKVTRGKAKQDDTKKKLNTWNHIWVSTQYGGKTRFVDDYERIKTEAEEKGTKLTSFQILSQLRSSLEAEDDQTRWTEWYEWVQKTNPDAPEDPPSVRQAKKEVKPKSVSSKSSKDKGKVVEEVVEEEEDDDEVKVEDQDQVKPKPAGKKALATKK